MLPWAVEVKNLGINFASLFLSPCAFQYTSQASLIHFQSVSLGSLSLSVFSAIPMQTVYLKLWCNLPAHLYAPQLSRVTIEHNPSAPFPCLEPSVASKCTENKSKWFPHPCLSLWPHLILLLHSDHSTPQALFLSLNMTVLLTAEALCLGSSSGAPFSSYLHTSPTLTCCYHIYLFYVIYF